MHKPKLILGTLLTIMGGGIMLIGIVLGTHRSISRSYRDIYTFPVSLTQISESENKIRFRTRGQVDFSFWLKVPNRKIEHKKFSFNVTLVSSSGRRQNSFGENFRFGYFRNSTVNGQYYKLGRYRSDSEFNGYLYYRGDGKWKPAQDGAIVLRRQENVTLPVKSIYVFTVGLFGMLLGIGTIAKNKTRPVQKSMPFML
jgi:hypothetical protein